MHGWGGMTHTVMLGPVFFDFNDGNPQKGVTSQRYVDQIILPHVRPFMRQHGNMVFMHDNAKPHTARHTHKRLSDRITSMLRLILLNHLT